MPFDNSNVILKVRNTFLRFIRFLFQKATLKLLLKTTKRWSTNTCLQRPLAQRKTISKWCNSPLNYCPFSDKISLDFIIAPQEPKVERHLCGLGPEGPRYPLCENPTAHYGSACHLG
jgi:hypothetical protein